MTLFVGGDQAAELAAFDRAWLSGLCSGIPNGLPGTGLRGVELAEKE